MRRPALALVAAAFVAACHDPGASVVVFAGPSMGTSYTVKVASEQPIDEARQTELARAVEDALADVDQRMSTYRSDSEVSRFNRWTETTPFAVSSETAEVVALALDISRRSRGTLDVTVGPLVDAWGFGPGREEARMPEPAALDELRARVGWEKLGVDLAASTLTKAIPELEIDLSAVAKGYAVDRVADELARLGVESAMVEVGGEVRATGRNGTGDPWQIGIERPDPLHPGLERVLPLDGLGMATSGDYRNYREVEGERFSHILDPRTGRPIDHRLASVTVLHPRCAVADGWATAMMVLGPEEGKEVALLEDLTVLLVARRGDGFVEIPSPAFEARYP